MTQYQIRIELLTETLFGNGEAIPGYMDIDVQTDQYGVPYLKAKTLKGLLREQMELVVRNLQLNEKCITNLFGTEVQAGKLRFSDATLNQNVKKALQLLSTFTLYDNKIEREDIKKIITTEYSYTKLDHGVASDHSLRTVRMLNKGMIFYADIEVPQDFSKEEECLLGCGVGLLKHVGTLKSKGKGYVKCDLIKRQEGKITRRCIKNIKETEEVH